MTIAGGVSRCGVRPGETTRVASRELLEKRTAEIDRQRAARPVGVQVVGRPWEEDAVLAAMAARPAKGLTGAEVLASPGLYDEVSARC